jgi:hypothetical protein
VFTVQNCWLFGEQCICPIIFSYERVLRNVQSRSCLPQVRKWPNHSDMLLGQQALAKQGHRQSAQSGCYRLIREFL